MTMYPLGAPTPAAPAPKSRTARRRPKPDNPRSWNLTLTSARTAVPVRMAAESPTLVMAAVEDLCWELAAATLRADRPHRWHRAEWHAWCAERDRLEAKRSRIQALTQEAINEL